MGELGGVISMLKSPEGFPAFAQAFPITCGGIGILGFGGCQVGKLQSIGLAVGLVLRR